MTYYQPALLVLILVTAFGLLRHKRRIAWLGLIGIFLWAWSPFAWLFSGTLEWVYPPDGLPPADAQAIVVLSGGIVQADPSVPEPYVGWDTYQRCRHASWLYHHWRAVPVIATGGPPGPLPVAELMRKELEVEGIPPDAIITEDRSMSTYENGLYTAPLLRARGFQKIVLVTEARHMPRSVLVFRKLGLTVIPAPCCSYTAGLRFTPDAFLPSETPIGVDNNVLHEWVGLAWYAIRGRI